MTPEPINVSAFLRERAAHARDVAVGQVEEAEKLEAEALALRRSALAFKAKGERFAKAADAVELTERVELRAAMDMAGVEEVA